MLKSDLVAKMAEANPHLMQRDVEVVVNTLFDAIGDTLARGDRIEIRGFGSFSVRVRPARMGRNPRNGEAVAVDEKRVVTFRAGKEIREALQRR